MKKKQKNIQNTTSVPTGHLRSQTAQAFDWIYGQDIFYGITFFQKICFEFRRPFGTAFGLRLHSSQIFLKNVTQKISPNPSYSRRSPQSSLSQPNPNPNPNPFGWTLYVISGNLFYRVQSRLGPVLTRFVCVSKYVKF